MTYFRRPTGGEVAFVAFMLFSGYRIYQFLLDVPPEPRPAPPIDYVIDNPAAILLEKIKPSHLKRKGSRYVIITLDDDSQECQVSLSQEINPFLFSLTKRNACVDILPDAVYDYELIIPYEGEGDKSVADESPHFAFDSRTRRLVYKKKSEKTCPACPGG